MSLFSRWFKPKAYRIVTSIEVQFSHMDRPILLTGKISNEILVKREDGYYIEYPSYSDKGMRVVNSRKNIELWIALGYVERFTPEREYPSFKGGVFRDLDCALRSEEVKLLKRQGYEIIAPNGDILT